ncbi:PTS sugar transporter subunit IIA [Collinsella sp. AGMB00827]|uniref:PTS sugar transporter subunit IIA n=1 Tax=Collinsella ureilytica TaxID=2869515 RepID=A0ABS7MJN1_9ACTN|nr:PTS sugar transporter subunit IIA [Collinsella urealyticum]MBY4797576.1 PTS sugar transporter subunit IIA [Collinsella urealyticum]
MAELAFSEDLVLIFAEDEIQAEEVEERLANMLLERGLVKDSFLPALLDRERNFPTGLEVPDGICAAVPHCDPEHVERGAICLGVLKHPVVWRKMDDPTATCPVSLVVMLALPEAHAHLGMLQRVIGLIQDQELVKQIVVSEHTSEVFRLSKAALA